MCSVTGTSAMPDLKPRDTVMVDLRDRSVANEGLHIVRLDDALMLKKLQRLPGKVLRVSSKNPEYPPFEIRSFEESQRDFEVIGRVRWGGITY
jgi:phage repressor protein C with HTH and peptisase S24 domain